MASTETFVPNSFSTDDETFSLIVNLLLEDVQQAASSAKGKQKEGVISDADLALRLYAEELGNAAVFASDRRMTRSVQRAIQADGDALGQSEREERMARNDREISAALSRGIDPAPNATTVDDADPSNAELEIFDKLSAIYVDGIDDDDDLEVRTLLGGQPESSSWAAVRQSRRTTPKRNCLACDETKHFTDIARAPCGHEYCRDCLAQLFQNAMTDEAYFPPRCCREAIPLEPNQMFLSPDLVRQFRVKSVEFSTPRRTYCFRPTCSAFIPPSRCQRDIATCGECGHQTCITCKGPSHFGDCPHDQSLQQVLQIADQEGWQRCTNCLSMIELNTGCFHMTCPCGAEFCYLCGTPWKICRCRQWDEPLLFDRAQEIYNRNQRPREIHHAHDVDVVPPAVREARINQIRDELRVNHECSHVNWGSIPGRRICEECGDMMPLFIYECRQCHIQACRHCRYNRL